MKQSASDHNRQHLILACNLSLTQSPWSYPDKMADRSAHFFSKERMRSLQSSEMFAPSVITLAISISWSIFSWSKTHWLLRKGNLVHSAFCFKAIRLFNSEIALV